jgi:hypothetical protein
MCVGRGLGYMPLVIDDEGRAPAHPAHQPTVSLKVALLDAGAFSVRLPPPGTFSHVTLPSASLR